LKDELFERLISTKGLRTKAHFLDALKDADRKSAEKDAKDAAISRRLETSSVSKPRTKTTTSFWKCGRVVTSKRPSPVFCWNQMYH
jgi:hypothetical protein